MSDKVIEVTGKTSQIEANEKSEKVLGKRQERIVEVDGCAEQSENCTVIIGWKGWCAFEGEEDEEPVEALINKRHQRRMMERATKLRKKQGNQSEVANSKEPMPRSSTGNLSHDSTSNVGRLELLGKALNEAARAEESMPGTTFTTQCFQTSKSSQMSDHVFCSGALVPCLSNSALFEDRTKMEGRDGNFESTEALKRQGFELIAQTQGSLSDRAEGATSGSSINNKGAIHTVEDVHQDSQVSALKGVATIDNTSVIQNNDTAQDGNASSVEKRGQKRGAGVVGDEPCDEISANGPAGDGLQGPSSNHTRAWVSSREGVLHLIIPKKKRSERWCRSAAVENGKVRMSRSIVSCERERREINQRRPDSHEAAEGPAAGPSVSCPICFQILTGDIESREFNTKLNWHIDKCIN